jgi:hypothetical protein
MKSKLLFSALLAAFLGITTVSMAQDGSMAKNHPRRSEVNQRLETQDRRIDHKVNNGNMSRHEAHNLHRKDHQIRREERRMASRHNGHITKQEQKRLNRQENHVSRKIHRA